MTMMKAFSRVQAQSGDVITPANELLTLLLLAPGIQLSHCIVPNRTNQHTGERRQHPLRTIAKQVSRDSYIG